MSALVPCTPGGSSHWSQRTALDGRDYLLTFDWCQRDGRWRLDVADADGVAIVSGVTLVARGYPLAGVLDARRPAGDLVVIDSTGANDLDPRFSDLGARFRLVYFAAAELRA